MTSAMILYTDGMMVAGNNEKQRLSNEIDNIISTLYMV